MKSWIATTTLMLGLFGATGCGDIGNVQVSVSFPDEETELKTRALLFVVREVPTDRAGCDDLWSDQPSGLAENRSVVGYPNRNDVVAAPVKLSQYPALTLLVYAHPSVDITTTSPIAGGCRETPINPDETQEVMIMMETAP